MKAKSTIESLLGLVSSVFNSWSVVYFQPEEEGRPAPLVAWHSQDKYIDRQACIPPGKGLVGWILRNKSPLLVESIEDNQAYLGYYREGYVPKIRSFMGCPVPGGGVLCVDSTRPNAFSEDVQRILHHFALFIPQIQQMASSNGHIREVNTYFTALEHMAELKAGYSGWPSYLNNLLQLLKEVTGYQYAAFATRAEGSPTYIVEGEYPPLVNPVGEQVEIPVASGIVGWVMRNGEGVFNEGTSGAGTTPLYGKVDNMPDFSASICLPVIIDRRTSGVLCLASLDPSLFSEEMRSFLRMAVDDVADLLEKIALKYRIKQLLPKAGLEKKGGVVYDPDSPKRDDQRLLDLD